jgi:Zn-dependent protease
MEVITAIVCLLVAFIIHEYAHGYFAYMLGDPTPKYNGRLSLNPLVHLDPMGAVVMLVTMLSFHNKLVMGWAKPVEFDESNLKSPKFDGALIAFGGPLANFVLVLLTSLLLHLGVPVGAFGVTLISANLGFGLFNCLPFPPLDGWKILRCAMPDSIADPMQRFEQKLGIWGVVILIVGSTFIVNPILQPVFTQLMDILARP